MATLSSILAWEILWTEEPGGLQSLGPGIALQAMQEKKALSSRGWGRLRGFLELRRPSVY